MTMREKAIDAIAEAQKAYKPDDKHYFVAEDLKELAGSLSEAEAALLCEDLAAGEVLQNCEKEIRVYARAHSGCCPARMVPSLLRKACGLPEESPDVAPTQAQPASAGRINILDML